MSTRIALAGNPNSGKTTLFNALTGANQFVGNWPGVTVEKKEGKLKKVYGGSEEVTITDLPGIYSLSPYTLEEVVARNYLIQERPDVILNIIDGTNLERNLYLSTQLMELGIPVVMAVNMMDVVRKNGDKIHIDSLSKKLGCEVVEISALKGEGLEKVSAKAIAAAKKTKNTIVHKFDEKVEQHIESVEERLGSDVAEEQKRFFAIKLLERDDKIADQMKNVPDVSDEITALEKEFDDDTESIITNERYTYITSIIDSCCTKASKNKLTISDKIDKVVTNRFAALPIFAVIMFIVYYVSVTTVGTWATDWANDGVFGDGWHLFGIGGSAYEEAADNYSQATNALDAYGVLVTDDEDAVDADATQKNIDAFKAPSEDKVSYEVEDEETLADDNIDVYYDKVPDGADEETTNGMSYLDAVQYVKDNGFDEPDPASYGVWVPGIPGLIEKGLDAVGCADWLHGLIIDGIVAGVGAVLGFVPQMLVLFIFLAFLEACGYMARIAFIMDRIFRRFGLSGKSFIPMLIGSGCGVPGIMASRTIESDRDRKITIMTTTFIPCGAKLPFIAMVAGAIFGGASWVAPSAYFLGIGAIIVSGIILKKTKLFAGDPAPFVMELPAYHLPTVGTVLRSMWERGWSFIKRAGTIILLSTIIIWFTTYFGWVEGSFQMLAEDQIEYSILARIGKCIAWLFAPLGWGNWQATVASVTGLVAKENIVATMGILYGGGDTSVYATMASQFTAVTGYAFLTFNLLCAPCFAAMGAIKREMNNTKWFFTAIGYQCGFAYIIALIVNGIGGMFTGAFSVWSVVAILLAVSLIYLLARPYKKANTLKM